MDVGDPSNFARIWDLYGKDHSAICRDISGATFSDEEIAETILQTWKKWGYLCDPHGACGLRALQEGLSEGESGIFLETAHPAKFRDTVEGIISSEVEIPEKLAAFMKGEKQSVPLSRDYSDFRQFLLQRAR